MAVLPNSAPDSLTPKNWNLFFALGQTALLDDGEDGAVVVDVGVVDVAVAPGWHCE